MVKTVRTMVETVRTVAITTVIDPSEYWRVSLHPWPCMVAMHTCQGVGYDVTLTWQYQHSSNTPQATAAKQASGSGAANTHTQLTHTKSAYQQA
eukprot:1153515-Pelagomonas_calceolata.AAC.1